MKKAFMLIELIFVIVILSILASVIIPEFTTARVEQAAIEKVDEVKGLVDKALKSNGVNVDALKDVLNKESLERKENPKENTKEKYSKLKDKYNDLKEKYSKLEVEKSSSEIKSNPPLTTQRDLRSDIQTTHISEDLSTSDLESDFYFDSKY